MVNRIKRKIFFVFLFVITVHHLSACDVCGCSSGNYFLGPTPQFGKQFIGLRYSFRSFNTVLSNNSSQYSKDLYQTTELWGGLKLNKKFEILAFVPFNINHSTTDDGVKTNNGLGDITVIGNYNIFSNESLCSDSVNFSHQLWFGAGVKLPTGKFNVDTSIIVASANDQAGTGSYDFLITASYNYMLHNWGLTSNVTYKINQAASDYRFGNRFDATIFGYHSFTSNKNSISPNIGLLYENLKPNQFASEDVISTGGYALLGAIGLEARFDKITTGFNLQLPLAENISDGQTKINIRGMLHLTYAF